MLFDSTFPRVFLFVCLFVLEFQANLVFFLYFLLSYFKIENERKKNFYDLLSPIKSTFVSSNENETIERKKKKMQTTKKKG